MHLREPCISTELAERIYRNGASSVKGLQYECTMPSAPTNSTLVTEVV